MINIYNQNKHKGLKGACGEIGAKGQSGRDAVCPQLQIKGEKGERGLSGPPGRDGPPGN